MSSPKSLKKETTSLSITSTEVDTKTTTLKVESATVASTSLKRSAEQLSEFEGEANVSEERATKVQKSAKIPAMFLPRSAVAQASTAFKWLPALALPAHQPRQLLPIISGPSTSTTKGDIPQVGPATCLYGIHLEQKATSKVAMFDLDDTLITRKSGKKFSDDSDDWKLWTTNVGEKLRNAVSDGFSIVVITNQAGLPVKGREAKWKQKIPQIAQSANASYFVGDAAGRTKPKDHSAVDRKLAHNMGIQFYTPDQFFKERKEKLPPLLGFHPSKLEAKDLMPSLISPSTTPEIVVFVGSPGCGKSSVFKKQFAPVGYVHVNQIHSKTRRDNTNRDKATRAEYIGIAKRLKCPVRCVWFDVAPELAWHNNMYRAFHQRVPDVESSTVLETSAATVIEGGDKELGSDITTTTTTKATTIASSAPRKLVPWIAYTTFRSHFQEPESSEGFDKIDRVGFVFEGSEEERERWDTYMEL
ncbi:bifunctional polynucleotide phosphatase/kinase [Rhizoctonia solani]|uniref:Bifunctional polynucleotide phosphatase/kinase n=1 Tax=Rhizoctonia solani TaxID=456999 RepID=A0A8H8P8E7_9AGAM|nr:bifunctional polynucleotide phosphatase/kinase [Rhizoctonia solani]QRW27466.1 bifunctional polynucleotide phosphatase/kinase [Rhizoctonia solani]